MIIANLVLLAANLLTFSCCFVTGLKLSCRIVYFIQTDLNEKIPLYAIMDDMTLPPLKQYDAVIHIRLGDFNGRPDFIETQHYIDLFNS